MADQLGIYKRAIRILGETRITALTDTRTIRFELDSVWDTGGREYCLEQGYWNFAMRSTEWSQDSDVTPDFGFRYGFSKPTDWVRTAALCIDEYFTVPLLQYEDEAQHVFADYDTLYLKYVSDDSQYGLNMGEWPESFTYAVACYFANEIAPQHTKSPKERDRLEEKLKKAFVDARSKDAMNEPTKFFAKGTFVSSRRGPRGGFGFDRGNRGSLIG